MVIRNCAKICAGVIMMPALFVMCSAFCSSRAYIPQDTQTSPRLWSTRQYDVVSIRPSRGGNLEIRGGIDSWDATDIGMRLLVANAFGIRPELIYGVPPELESKRFDIHAKIVLTGRGQTFIPPRQQGKMLQGVLRDRFKLHAHTVVVVMKGYDLVQDKRGSRLKEASETGGSSGTQGVPIGSMMMRNGELTAHGISMAVFTVSLSGIVQRDVLDKTGLHGLYDIHLQWDPNEMDEDAVGQDSIDHGSYPPIFAALEAQLGLKLQPARNPVVTLVVDHIEYPSPN
jgi:uncharacterized protein (TIGR03435 family)